MEGKGRPYTTKTTIYMRPLAERMRPQSLDDYAGQSHLVGPGGAVRRMVESGRLQSFILWGPPGVGKTTLALILAKQMNLPFYQLSAVQSGVKDVRDVIERAKGDRFFNSPSPILFIDEIHRFNKAQQDSLLGAVERGTITLIGATTENPSFEVIRPLLSRCQVFVLQELGPADLEEIVKRAVANDSVLSTRDIAIEQTRALIAYSGGDARRLLGLLEMVVGEESHITITDALVEKWLEANPLAYDKGGEMHYDIISAFIKSIRGSDDKAAIYWLARMLEAGEDPLFIARRLVISATEDIGLANPNALLMANAAFDAVSKIGMPEGRIPLAEATVFLARQKKSNESYMMLGQAQETVRRTGNLPVPLHLRNAPTELMKRLGYSDGYKYPHDYPGHWVEQQYLPDALAGVPQQKT